MVGNSSEQSQSWQQHTTGIESKSTFEYKAITDQFPFKTLGKLMKAQEIIVGRKFGKGCLHPKRPRKNLGGWADGRRRGIIVRTGGGRIDVHGCMEQKLSKTETTMNIKG
jgi:hypothetical protein